MWESHSRASIKRLLLARIGGGFKRAGLREGARPAGGMQSREETEHRKLPLVHLIVSPNHII